MKVFILKTKSATCMNRNFKLKLLAHFNSPRKLVISCILTSPIVSSWSALSYIFPTQAEVPQGTILAPISYMVYTADVPQHPSTFLASFANDKAVLSYENPVTASLHLQEHLNSLQTWFHEGGKIVPITSTLKRSSCPIVFLNNMPIPTMDAVKYLGIMRKLMTYLESLYTP